MAEIYVIGLTGNIATGKSTVARLLEEQGAFVIDTDKEAHAVLAPGQPAHERVVAEFGAGTISEDGRIDRARLGAVVFSDPQALRRLEAIVHPSTIERVRDRVRQLAVEAAAIPAGTPRLVVIEAIKLLESDLGVMCDSVWVVICNRQEQLRRLVETRHHTREEALARLEAQPPAELKIARANVVIDNCGSLEETRRQVRHALAEIAG